MVAKISQTPPKLREDTQQSIFFEEIRKRLNVASVADLNQTIAGPSNAEVQAISDKVDELLAALRLAGTMAS